MVTQQVDVNVLILIVAFIALRTSCPVCPAGQLIVSFTRLPLFCPDRGCEKTNVALKRLLILRAADPH